MRATFLSTSCHEYNIVSLCSFTFISVSMKHGDDRWVVALLWNVGLLGLETSDILITVKKAFITSIVENKI